jgi:4-amino-4-deoxy-L-arabinose transferase-like glycosyltransferase
MSGNITNYDYFSSFVYSITGYSPLSLFFISSVAGSIAAIFIYFITKELFSKNIAKISSLFAFFWPSFVLWSTQNLKEPVIAMFTFILLWGMFYMRKHSLPLVLTISVISILVLAKVSFPIVTVIAGALFCSVLYLTMWYLLKDKFLSFLITVILIFIAGVFFKDKILSYINEKSAYNIFGFKSVFDFLDYHRGVRAYGNLQFFRNFDISNPLSALSFVPLGLIFAVFSPFPWQLGSAMQIMAVPETLIFYILFPCTLRGIAFALKKRFEESILILTIIGIMLIFLSLVEGNSGTLFRHRAVVFYLIFIFTAMGITLRKKGRISRA